MRVISDHHTNEAILKRLNEFSMIFKEYGANLHQHCWIGENVSIGPRTAIWPYITIDGNVTIGEDCVIGKGATIIASPGKKIVIGNNVKIGHHVEITGGGYIRCGNTVKSDLHNPRMPKNSKALISA